MPEISPGPTPQKLDRLTVELENPALTAATDSVVQFGAD